MVFPRDRSQPPRTVLLWKIGALGDVLMTTPLLRQLRAALPNSRIDYLTGNGCMAVLQGNPHIDQVLGFDESILYAGQVARAATLLPLLRGYDAIFVLDKHWIFSLLAWLARAPMRVGFSRRWHEGALHTHRVPYGALRHEIDCYLDLAAVLQLPVDRADTRLELPVGEPFSLPEPYVVLVNSGGDNRNERSSVRRLPPPLFDELVASCSGRATLVFLGTQAESAQYDRYASRTALNLCGRTSLRQAWTVLQRAQAVYTTDTGLMHMAAAVNANVTAIFGPTHPLRKCPPGARWVGRDEALYRPDYELFGRVPAARYFRTLRAEDILERAQPGPL